VPAFEFEGQLFQNPVELALHVIGGKWKMPILWRLEKRTWRYNEMRRDLPGISHKMLTQQLRELEQHGLITRTVHPVVPPHVDYALTPLGRSTVPIIESLREWGSTFRTRRTRAKGLA
jgi:DNA-binding HxlR family transcriptional regulator